MQKVIHQVRKWQLLIFFRILSVRGTPSDLNTLRPRQDGRRFPDDIFKWLFFNEIIWISIKIFLKFVLRGPINNIPALVQIMAWRLPGDKPLSEPMIVKLPTHICVTRPQWVKKTVRGHALLRRVYSVFRNIDDCDLARANCQVNTIRPEPNGQHYVLYKRHLQMHFLDETTCWFKLHWSVLLTVWFMISRYRGNGWRWSHYLELWLPSQWEIIRVQWALLITRFKQSITMTSWWPCWRLKSPASRLFTQSFIQA